MRENAIRARTCGPDSAPVLEAYSASTPAGSTFAAIGNRKKGGVVAAGGVSDRQAALASPPAITADAVPEHAVFQITEGYNQTLVNSRDVASRTAWATNTFEIAAAFPHACTAIATVAAHQQADASDWPGFGCDLAVEGAGG